MTEFDDDGCAIPGTYAISTVHIGMWGSDGAPVPTVESAVCDTCGGWAATLCSATSRSTVSNSLTDRRVSRFTTTVVYTCPEHYEAAITTLVDEFGSASNWYGPDELALEVVSKHKESFHG